MGISNPRLSVPRDPPVWCEAETGSAANITPELPAEREKTLSKHGRRRAVINPHPRMVGRSGRLGAATRVVPQRFVFRLCLLGETKAIFLTGEKQLPTRTVGRIVTAGDRSRRNSRVIPRPVRRLVVGIRNTPAQIQRGRGLPQPVCAPASQ